MKLTSEHIKNAQTACNQLNQVPVLKCVLQVGYGISIILVYDKETGEKLGVIYVTSWKRPQFFWRKNSIDMMKIIRNNTTLHQQKDTRIKRVGRKKKKSGTSVRTVKSYYK